MAMDITPSSVVCRRCGKAFGRYSVGFYVNKGALNKSSGYMQCCTSCVDEMFGEYYKESKDYKKSMRQLCRKLDLYWNEQVWEPVERSSAPQVMVSNYIKKINAIRHTGKCYDDTLREEGMLWDFSPTGEAKIYGSDEDVTVSDDVIAFWGPGYTSKMYAELEQRRHYWMSRFPSDAEIDIGTEALIRQICNLEIDINKDRAAGKPIDKSVNALNTLLGSAMLKPAQKKDDSASNDVPFGVGIGWCEKHKPIKEPSEEFKDVDGIIKYITIWLYGHLGKMMGKKNLQSRLYEDEMERLKVVRPEYHDVDDEQVLYEILTDESDE